MSAPSISVVVCTHNRAGTLESALNSLLTQEGLDHTEIVVVDNRSTDNTADVIRSAATRGPVRYVREETLGLCHARNAGWREAQGELVAYFDDDALALPGWLTAIATAFAEGGPHVGCVGGRVDPLWEAPRPAWLSDQVALGLTIIDWAPEPFAIVDVGRHWLVGVNMAVRRDLLEKVGGFHPALDRVGTRMLSSGDVFLLKQVQACGYGLRYEPRMRVQHLIPRNRLTKSWFRRRYYWQGVSDAVMEVLEDAPTVAQRGRRATSRARALLQSPRRLLDLAHSTNDPVAFEQQCWTWIELGRISGLLGAGGR